MSDQTRPVLVDTAWVASHRGDHGVRLVEVDVDTGAYGEGHIPGAVGWNWTTQLQDQVRRDLISREDLERLMGESGIGSDDLVVLYGDNNNWFAAYAYWILKLYGHRHVKLMDGGRKKWLAEGRELTREPEHPVRVSYRAAQPDPSIRAVRDDVVAAVSKQSVALVDVRSPQEFTGEVLAPPGLSETAQRGGHIPGAINVPWARVVREDGTFKSNDELRALYAEVGVTGAEPVIAYCRIGERSSHTWFALHELLGFDDVRNYDGSWTEWGSMVGVPIER